MGSNEYPEHLNPFMEETKPKPKTKLTLRNSFSRLRQSFRRIIKDDRNDVTIRRKRVDDPVPRFTQSTQSITPALPRSRFHDRVTYNPANPFDDPDEANLDVDSLQRNTIRRKTKKKAPLPPKSLSNDHLNEPSLRVFPRASNWSLTSADTEYSEEAPREQPEDRLPLDEVREITKGLEQLIGDDSNNNKIEEKPSEIPDIVVSCANNNDAGADCTDAICRITEDVENCCENDENKSIIQDGGNEVVEDENDDELVVTDITHNLVQDDSENTPTNGVDSDNNRRLNSINEDEQTDLNYNERKSIYITGSKDELNNSDAYCDKISIYITSSVESFDKTNNNVSNSEEDVTDGENAPVPKLRKHKLSKSELLGA